MSEPQFIPHAVVVDREIFAAPGDTLVVMLRNGKPYSILPIEKTAPWKAVEPVTERGALPFSPSPAKAVKPHRSRTKNTQQRKSQRSGTIDRTKESLARRKDAIISVLSDGGRMTNMDIHNACRRVMPASEWYSMDTGTRSLLDSMTEDRFLVVEIVGKLMHWRLANNAPTA